jgi:hypothetical protein
LVHHIKLFIHGIFVNPSTFQPEGWNLLGVDPERQGINLKETLFSNAFRAQKPPKLSELGNHTEGDHTYKENALLS